MRRQYRWRGTPRNRAQAVKRWGAKPSLRAVYSSSCREISKRVRPDSRVLEIGAGSGHSRDFYAGFDVVRLDILPAPWVDMVADAHDIPVPDASMDAIVMLDVLHHLADPPKFFTEVLRILKPAGRFVMLEPGISLVSGAFYRAFHEEPVIMKIDPMKRQEYGADKDPFESNQATPTLLFKYARYRKALEARFPQLKIIEARRKSLFAYPMTGGFQPWTMLPAPLVGPVLGLELVLEPVLGRLMAFRLLVTLEKAKA